MLEGRDGCGVASAAGANPSEVAMLRTTHSAHKSATARAPTPDRCACVRAVLTCVRVVLCVVQRGEVCELDPQAASGRHSGTALQRNN